MMLLSSKLRLTFACEDYDRTRALREGTLQIRGIDLVYLPMRAEEAFWRMCRHEEFDIAEMSLSALLIEKSYDRDRFVAIPAFPSKSFRHNAIFINANSGIERPEDLKGKRVGVPEYSMTATVWIRGFLQDDYGVKPTDVTWVTGGLETSGRADRVDFELPSNLRFEEVPEGSSLSRMLENGEIDALITAPMPSSWVNRSPKVARLFPNYKEVEMEYYRRTRIFPIMHTVVIRRDLHERHPWIAFNMYEALCKAKDICFEKMYQTSALPYSLPWLIEGIEESRELMGDDYWAYGLEPNRHIIETLARYSYEQGLSRRLVSVDELFPASVLSPYKI